MNTHIAGAIPRSHRREDGWSALAWLLAAGWLLALPACHPGEMKVLEPLHDALARREIARGQRLMADQSFVAAAAAFENSLAHDPDSGVAHASLGELCERRGDMDAAIAHYRAAVKAEPEAIRHALLLADALRRSALTSMRRAEVLDCAVRAYCYALALDRDSYQALIGLGLCYRQAGEWNKALRVTLRAAQIEQDAAAPHAILATVHEARGRLDLALAEYRQAIRLSPDDPALHNACADLNLVLAREGGPRKVLAAHRAMAHYRRSLELRPDQPAIRETLRQLDPMPNNAVTVIDEDLN